MFENQKWRCVESSQLVRFRAGMRSQLANYFRTARIDRDPVEMDSLRYIHQRFEAIVELHRPYLQEAITTRCGLQREALADEAEAVGRTWILMYLSRYRNYLRGYYADCIERLEQFGLCNVLTPEEVRHLQSFRLLYPDQGQLPQAVLVAQCGYDLGVKQSQQEFDRNLAICRSFAYRKGVHDELKDHVDWLSREGRDEVAQTCKLLWEQVQLELKTYLIPEAYAAGKLQAWKAIEGRKQQR